MPNPSLQPTRHAWLRLPTQVADLNRQAAAEMAVVL